MEQQTKNCPYCSGEIMAAAKKCKYCGKWLDGREDKNEIPTPTHAPVEEAIVKEELTPQEAPAAKEESATKDLVAKESQTKNCPYCGEEILIVAKKCKHCGEWLEKPTSTAKKNDSTPSPKAKNDKGVFDKSIGYLGFEPFIIAGFLSGLYDWGWWKPMLVAIVIVGVLHLSRSLRIICCVLFSALWAFVAVLLCPWIFNESQLQLAARALTDNYTDYWYVGIGVFVVALILHWTSMQDNK